MFLAVGALLHQLLCFEATPSQRRNYTLAILGVLIPVSWYHCWADEIYVHEIVFAAMVIMVVRRTRKLIRERVKNVEHKKRLGQLASLGIGKLFSTLLQSEIWSSACWILERMLTSSSELPLWVLPLEH
jgi:dihydroceramidase